MAIQVGGRLGRNGKLVRKAKRVSAGKESLARTSTLTTHEAWLGTRHRDIPPTDGGSEREKGQLSGGGVEVPRLVGENKKEKISSFGFIGRKKPRGIWKLT